MALLFDHIIVLMLENRSFDSMLGMLYPSGDGFDGLTGTEQNTWHKKDGSPPQTIPCPQRRACAHGRTTTQVFCPSSS